MKGEVEVVSVDERGRAVDPVQPTAARIYDYFLGGRDNYEVDRQAAAQVEAVFPSVGLMARTNRDFMHRATRWLAREAGIRQFLDIGVGIPTEPNLHQIAQEIAPDARVVYVDNDPVVLAHARALMGGTEQGRTAYIEADVTIPAMILDAPELRETLDLSRPVALSMIALFHFIPDDRAPYRIVSTLLDALAPGSYLVMSHATADFDPQAVSKAVRIYRAGDVTPQVRSRNEFEKFFRGLELVEPGVIPPHRWRPDNDIEPSPSMDASVSVYAAVARK
jgi:SAM-dependent methyltransferase